jgi:hypothetical protein
VSAVTIINGLPAHILLVHAVVVFVPLTALMLVLVGVWPKARRRLSVPTAVLAAVTTVLVPVTTQAGEWLEHRVERTDLLRAHTQLGDTLLPWVIGLLLVAVAIAARQLVSQRRAGRLAVPAGPGTATATRSPRGLVGGRVVTALLAVLAIAVAVGATVDTYRIGDSGSRAAWTGHFSQQPLWGRTGPVP